jgi:predicted deacylase
MGAAPLQGRIVLVLLAAVALVALEVGLWPSQTPQATTMTPTAQPEIEVVRLASPPQPVAVSSLTPSPTAGQASLRTPTPRTTEQPQLGRAIDSSPPSPTASAELSATSTARHSVSASPTPAVTPTVASSVVISQELGLSTGGWPIELYRFGNGPVQLAFVGGMHGGYEWNTIILAYTAIDYLMDHPNQLPEDITLYIVPVANPDGQVQAVNRTGRFSSTDVLSDTFPGRFNANQVDLNRNWDCNWEAIGYWGNTEVSAGSEPFSEIETQVLRDFLVEMQAAVFWHSAKPGVFFGECETRSVESEALAAIYAEGSGYPLYMGFNDYSVTGAASDWLASQGIPAIAVELTNHSDVDWQQNLAGMLAVINAYSSSAAR